MTIEASAIYREGPPTEQDYLDAIEDLQNAMNQLKPNGRNCTVCGDSDHQAFECRHNPLLRAREAASKDFNYWRCFHCRLEFHNAEDAREHFGDEQNVPPACLKDVAKLIALMKAAVMTAITRHDLRSEEMFTLEEEMDLEEIEQIACDAADAMRGYGTCKQEAHPEWKAFFESSAEAHS